MRIAMVGQGRLGRAVGAALRQRHEVVALGRGDVVPHDVDVAWLAVPDGALPEVARTVPDGVVVLFSAGVLDRSALPARQRVARVHPLVPFAAGQRVDLHGAAARVDGDAQALPVARQLAADLGLVPFTVDGDPALYHAAAVLAGNHLPALLLDAVEVFRRACADTPAARAGLFRLARSALDNVEAGGAAALTGPAVRGDAATEASHGAALRGAGLEESAALYAEGARTVRRCLTRMRSCDDE